MKVLSQHQTPKPRNTETETEKIWKDENITLSFHCGIQKKCLRNWENFHFHKVGPWVITPINGLFFQCDYKWTYFTLGAHLASGSAIPDSTPRSKVKSLKVPGGSGSYMMNFVGACLEVCGLFPGRNIQVYYTVCIISKCVGTQMFSFCTCFLIRFVF